MAKRRPFWLLIVGAIASLGASYRTPNFAVEAATPEIAKQVGDYAEHYRREKALQWLGREMPVWPQPCPIKVTITMNGSGGATSFVFRDGRVAGQTMHIEGTLERLLNSVLPHEVTHTVYAFHFRQPVPRWADEGGSVLSEDDIERQRHDALVRQILNNRRGMPLRRLFTLKEYPPEVLTLYAQGYSVTDFLVSLSSRPGFLNFVADGMRGDWDGAVRNHYRFNSVEELEQAWLKHLIDTKKPSREVVASGQPVPNQQGQPMQRVVVRQTVPPTQPLEDGRAIYRGQSPDDGYGSHPFRPTGMVNHSQGAPSATSATPSAWQPVRTAPPQVHLGPPQFYSPNQPSGH